MANQPIFNKILIIEDDQPIRQLYELKLSGFGHQIKTASNGQEGLQICQEFKPDLILLDIRMPVMNGDAMLEKLRATEWGQNIRVIVLTNISRDEAPAVLRFLNVDRYIVKAHHTPQQVLDIVNEVIA